MPDPNQMYGNPMYNTGAVTPPGLSALPGMVGGYIAPYVGGYSHPYVPANQSTFGAIMAKNVNDPLYKSMMARTYGQMFAQAAATAGSLPIVQSFGSMVGYTPQQIQHDLTRGGAAFGRSAIGSMLAPLADQGLNALGLSGGSFIDVAENAFSNRFNLLSPGIMVNPMDLQMQHQAMKGASAVAQMINGLSSKWKNGQAMLAPNMQFTQGLDRGTVSQVVMRMAGAGAFNGTDGKGLVDQMQEALGGRDLGSLEWSKGDFLGGKEGNEGDKKLAEITKRFARQAAGGIKAVSAMRDFLGEIDGAIEKLDALTNGNWSRSGAGGYAASDAVRRLHSVSQLYNLDPNAAAERILYNRGALQNAAGFGGTMRYMGFDGGGLFGLEAQTELLANIEDMISRRGLRGDPIRAERVRRQALQAHAQTMNTRGGVAAQLLAWGRQTGVVSEEQAAGFAAELTSGDRSVMGDALNRLLTLEFGSAERGKKMMNDAAFIQTMRQSLTDKSGAYANNLMTLGADREVRRRELVNAAAVRYEASTDALAQMGMNVNQSDADIEVAIRSMASSLKGGKFGTGGDEAAKYIMLTYKNHIDRGESAQSAIQSVLSDLQTNPSLAKYYEHAKMAMDNSLSGSNEKQIEKNGLPSITAKLLTESMERGGAISGEQASNVYALLQEGKADEALQTAEGYLAKTNPDERKIYEKARSEAKRQHTRQVESQQARRDATTMLEAAREGGFGASDVVDSLSTVADAARRYGGKVNEEEFLDLVAKSGFREKLGEDMYRELMNAQRAGADSLHAFGGRLGRSIAPLQAVAVKNLQDNGHGAEMWGYWGGGLYSGNSTVARDQRESLMQGLMKSMDESSTKDAGDRQSVANDAIDFFTGHKNWKELLKIYDPTGAAGSTFAKYGEAFSTYNDAYEDLQGYKDKLSDIEQSLDKSGNYDASRQLRQMLADGNMDDKAVDDFIAGAGITDSDQIETLRGAAKAQQKMLEARKASDAVLIDTFNDPKAVATMQAIAKREQYEKQKQASYGSEKYDAAVDLAGSLSTEALGKIIGSDNLNGKLVSPEALAAKLGTTVGNIGVFSQEQRSKARMQVIRDAAAGGNKDAMGVMDRAKAYADREKSKIYGELVIKDGHESKVAVLTGSIGGGLS